MTITQLEYNMVTMREAVAGYRKRYFGDNNQNDLKDAGIVVGNPESIYSEAERLDRHDIYHIIASGIAELTSAGKGVEESLKEMEKSGLVSRNVGIKAEIIADIYYVTMKYNVDRFESLDDFNYKTADSVFSEDRYKTLLSISKNDIKAKDAAAKPLSDVPEVAALMDSVRELKDHNKISGEIITPEEIEFHINKAITLNKKLRKEHPECATISDEKFFSDIGLDRLMSGLSEPEEFTRAKHFNLEKLLDLPLEAFRIDNFRAAEKIKLGDSIRGRGGVGFPP